ncbi:hypothetical protein M405DRAFT_870137 [Rhizopogon salebrosus TDB-379]|nr:hypothetical protein M405DRAFT_870137 [Rhizopogon salebrosus TDB-379]
MSTDVCPGVEIDKMPMEIFGPVVILLSPKALGDYLEAQFPLISIAANGHSGEALPVLGLPAPESSLLLDVATDDCIPLDDIVPMDDLVALPGSVILDDQGDPIPSDDLDGDAPTFDPIPSVGYPILFINQVASNNAVPSGNIIEKVVKDEEAPSSDDPQLTRDKPNLMLDPDASSLSGISQDNSRVYCPQYNVWIKEDKVSLKAHFQEKKESDPTDQLWHIYSFSMRPSWGTRSICIY